MCFGCKFSLIMVSHGLNTLLRISLTAKIVFYTIFKPQSNRSILYVNNVTLRFKRQPDRSNLFFNNGDVMQTAAVRTAAVCLGH